MAFQRGAVALEVGHEGGVDVVVLERDSEDGRHEAAVLAHLGEHRVGGPGEHDVLEDARHLLGVAAAAEQVNSSISGSHARNRGQARVHDVQPFSPWLQLSGPQLVLELERLVDALGVVVAEHVVRARDHAAGAPGAQPGGDDLGVEVLPAAASRAASDESGTAARRHRQVAGTRTAPPTLPAVTFPPPVPPPSSPPPPPPPPPPQPASAAPARWRDHRGLVRRARPCSSA